MSRLHAGHHTELREPPEVVRVHELHVHELMPAVARAVHTPGVRDRVERRADPPVADRVRERLEPRRSSSTITSAKASGS